MRCWRGRGPGSTCARSKTAAVLWSRVLLFLGGEYLLSRRCRCVEEHETLGDGSFLADEANAARIEALPACSNDSEGLSDAWPNAGLASEGAGSALGSFLLALADPRDAGLSAPPTAAADKLELVRARLFENSDFWPMGPYGFDDAGVEDEYVYYDQSAYMPAAAYRR